VPRPGRDLLDAPPDDRPIAPLPVTLHEASFRYPGARTDALTAVSLTVDVGEFVAVVGHNGSGKSTLTRLLAGRPPSTGAVERPGSAGLGRLGGTALVLQRPESQTLGVQVADDVVWGLSPELAEQVEVESLLAEVGLGGMGKSETATLSGGQQQRLAVAAALARRPALLIADVIRQKKPALPVAVASATVVLVLVALIFFARPIAQRESVRDLLLLADQRGYANVPVLARDSDDRSPQFYAYDRVVYKPDGEVMTFDEISVDEARARGGKFLVFIPVEYVEHFRGKQGIEVISDNGRTAMLGWKP